MPSCCNQVKEREQKQARFKKIKHTSLLFVLRANTQLNITSLIYFALKTTNAKHEIKIFSDESVATKRTSERTTETHLNASSMG